MGRSESSHGSYCIDVKIYQDARTPMGVHTQWGTHTTKVIHTPRAPRRIARHSATTTPPLARFATHARALCGVCIARLARGGGADRREAVRGDERARDAARSG